MFCICIFMTEKFLLFFSFFYFLLQVPLDKQSFTKIFQCDENVWPLYGINWESNLFRFIINHRWPSIEIESFVWLISCIFLFFFFFSQNSSAFVIFCNNLHAFTFERWTNECVRRICLNNVQGVCWIGAVNYLQR